MTTKGRIHYRKPNMAHPPPGTTPGDTMESKRRTWLDRVASLRNFRDHIPGDIPTPDNQQPAPSTYMPLMYNKHYTLSTTHYHPPTDTCVVDSTGSLLPANYPPPPPPHSSCPDTYSREDEPDDPHIWGSWGCKSLDTLLSIRSSNQGLGRTMYCLAK